MACLERLAVAAATGTHLEDPAGADPDCSDVLRCLSGPELPGDVTAVAVLLIVCHKKDVPLPLKLTADLAVNDLLVGSTLRGRLRLHGQADVAPCSWRAAEQRPPPRREAL